jgi:hypothetical protein
LIAALGGTFYLSPYAVSSLGPLADALEAKRILSAKKDLSKDNPEAVKLVGEAIALIECV